MKFLIETYIYRDPKLKKIKGDDFPIPVINSKVSIKNASKILSHSKYRCCFVLDKDGKILNYVSQGDLLRFIEKRDYVKSKIEDLLKFKPNFKVALNSAQAKRIMQKHNYDVIPLVDLDNLLIGASIRSVNYKKSGPKKERIGLIISGGLGKRLLPLTKETPKPLLKLGNKTILDHVFDSLELLGVRYFNVMAGHLSEKFDRYKAVSERPYKLFIEKSPLGTGGPLLKWIHEESELLFTELKNKDELTIIVCNGDLIFEVDEQTISSFEKSKYKICILSRKLQHSLKFGLIETRNHLLKSFKEKPTFSYNVNTGIYLFKIDLKLLNQLKKFPVSKIDMPDLLIKVKSKIREKILIKEIKGNYFDLGTPDDLLEVSAFYKE